MKLTLQRNEEVNEFENVEQILCGIMNTESDESLKFTIIANPDITFTTAMQLLNSITMHMVFAFVKTNPEARETIYDAYNMMASTVLQNIIPDKELRSDITTEAIMELEAKKIEESYESLSDEAKEMADKRLAELKESLTKNAENTQDN